MLAQLLDLTHLGMLRALSGRSHWRGRRHARHVWQQRNCSVKHREAVRKPHRSCTKSSHTGGTAQASANSSSEEENPVGESTGGVKRRGQGWVVDSSLSTVPVNTSYKGIYLVQVHRYLVYLYILVCTKKYDVQVHRTCT